MVTSTVTLASNRSVLYGQRFIKRVEFLAKIESGGEGGRKGGKKGGKELVKPALGNRETGNGNGNGACVTISLNTGSEYLVCQCQPVTSQ